MVKSKEKQRGKVRKQRAKFVVIGAEGKNKTERNYFHDFFKTNKEYKVKFSSSGDTDPERIVNDTIKYIEKEEINLNDGDVAFCFVDTDTDITKQPQIDKALKLASDNGIELLLSNPCFEVWFIQHFNYSTRSFANNAAVIAELQKHIPSYEKNTSAYSLLVGKTEDAINNAEKLEKYHDGLGNKEKHISRNPSSEVFKAIKAFKQ